MDFTREPIIETIVTPKDGCKLVVRCSSKAQQPQEEFFVDAVEVVSFGGTFFYRSKERPKPFLVPATDYEILEVREARMVIRNVTVDQASKSNAKETKRQNAENETPEQKSDKKRRSHRKKAESPKVEKQEQKPAPVVAKATTPPKPAVLIAPPDSLISESIGRYKENFKDVFIIRPEKVTPAEEQHAEPPIPHEEERAENSST